MSLMTSHLRYASGPAPNVAFITIATSMRQTISWPRDSRWLPVERLSDLSGHQLNRASLDEAGRPSRERGNPRPSKAAGGCQQWYPNHLSVGAVQYERTSTQAKYAHFRPTGPRLCAASADRHCQRGDVRDTRLVPLGPPARGALGAAYAHCPWHRGG